MAKLPITYKGKPIAATAKKKKGADGGSRKWLWLLLVLLIAAGVAYAVYRFSRGNENGVISRTTETVRQLAAGKNGQEGTETARLPVSVPLDQDGRSGIALRALANGEKLYAQKHYAGARDQARIAMGKFSYTDPKWQESADLLNRCSTRILNGDGSSRETFVYTVQRGDSYSRIGAKFGTTAEAVQRINKVSPSQTVLRIGQELIVYNGKWSIKISNAHKKLFLYDGASVCKVYPIGTAMEFTSPQGVYTLHGKLKYPTWNYRGNSYRPGDPLNILGSRSLSCSDAAEYKLKQPFLIHGTNKAENIGKTIAGPGFISMKNDDINELYSLIPEGIRVEIIR